MALHGDIKVNGFRIASWSARRTVDLTDTEAIHPYECEVSWQGKLVKFELEHRYSDGAVALASVVLRTALRVGRDL